MRIDDIEVKWDMGSLQAADLIECIQLVCTSENIVRADGLCFTVQKDHEGRVVVTLEPDFYRV